MHVVVVCARGRIEATCNDSKWLPNQNGLPKVQVVNNYPVRGNRPKLKKIRRHSVKKASQSNQISRKRMTEMLGTRCSYFLDDIFERLIFSW